MVAFVSGWKKYFTNKMHCYNDAICFNFSSTSFGSFSRWKMQEVQWCQFETSCDLPEMEGSSSQKWRRFLLIHVPGQLRQASKVQASVCPACCRSVALYVTLTVFFSFKTSIHREQKKRKEWMRFELRPDLAKFCHFGEILKFLTKKYDFLFSIWQNFEPTFAYLVWQISLL